MKQGDTLVVFNGEGGEYNATIASASKKSVAIQLHDFKNIDRESPLNTNLAIGISKGERFDWVLQKATELGVSQITPVVSERTEVRLGNERQEKVMQRWQKILINTCEQCYRNRLPTLQAPVDFSAFLTQEKSEQKLILHPPQEEAQATVLDKTRSPTSICLLIGPEGGFSDAELKQALQNSFNPLSLGPRILRTETAPIAALSVLQFLWGDR